MLWIFPDPLSTGHPSEKSYFSTSWRKAGTPLLFLADSGVAIYKVACSVNWKMAWLKKWRNSKYSKTTPGMCVQVSLIQILLTYNYIDLYTNLPRPSLFPSQVKNLAMLSVAWVPASVRESIPQGRDDMVWRCLEPWAIYDLKVKMLDQYNMVFLILM